MGNQEKQGQAHHTLQGLCHVNFHPGKSPYLEHNSYQGLERSMRKILQKGAETHDRSPLSLVNIRHVKRDVCADPPSSLRVSMPSLINSYQLPIENYPRV